MSSIERRRLGPSAHSSVPIKPCAATASTRRPGACSGSGRVHGLSLLERAPSDQHQPASSRAIAVLALTDIFVPVIEDFPLVVGRWFLLGRGSTLPADVIEQAQQSFPGSGVGAAVPPGGFNGEFAGVGVPGLVIRPWYRVGRRSFRLGPTPGMSRWTLR